MESLIEWCQAEITSRFPNFRFKLLPLYNSAYLPDVSLPSANELRFPYPDESFDFVFAHSVFTHLLPDASANYLREIKRVLRRGGISYTTWFLFKGTPLGNAASLIAGMELDPSGDFALSNPEVPDSAVGYEESFVRGFFGNAGLSIIEPIHPGFKKLQDAIVANR
jgi:SAM-dependent methyltransferase